MIDYTKYQKALKHLELQYENYSNLDERTDLKEIDREAVAESVIQRFETCYDCQWKILKRYLTEELGVPELPNSPKPIFRIAFENKLLASDVDQWLKYADSRIDTSHDYSEAKAQEALSSMKEFIDDAIGLYQTMTGTTWE